MGFFKKIKPRDFFGAIILLGTVTNQILDLLKSPVVKFISLTLAHAWLVFAIFTYLTSIIKDDGKETGFAGKEKYSEKSRSTAKRIRAIPLLSLLCIPFYFYHFLFPILFPKPCTPDKEIRIGVVIAPFSNIKPGEQDDFSETVASLFNNEVSSCDSTKAFTYSYPFSTNCIGYLDTAKKIFDCNCLSQGLIVFGKRRSQENYIDFSVFVQLPDPPCQNKVSSKDVMYIQNPPLVSFSADTQSRFVVNFLLGVVRYYSGNDSGAKQSFFLAEKSCNDCKALIAYCNLFVGNIYARSDSSSVAIEYYQRAAKNGLENKGYLQHNIGVTYLKIQDTAAAFNAFAIAEKSDNQFKTPTMVNMWKENASSQKQIEAFDYDSKIINMFYLKDTTVMEFYPKITALKIDGITKYGVVNKSSFSSDSSSIILPFKFDSIWYKPIDGRIYIMLKKNSKYSVANSKGDIVVAEESTEASAVAILRNIPYISRYKTGMKSNILFR